MATLYDENTLSQKINEARQRGVPDSLISARVNQLRSQGAIGSAPKKQSRLAKIASSGWSPTVGSIVGGVAGGVLGGPLGAIAGAGLGGGAGEVIRQESTPELDNSRVGIAKEMALGAGGQVIGGAVGKVVGKVGGKIAGKVLPKVGKLVTNTADDVADASAARLTKASPTAFRRVSELQGKNLNDITRKYFDVTDDYDTLLGGVTEKGRGGKIKVLLGEAENAIQSEVKQAGEVIKFSSKELTKALSKEKRLLKRTVGNDKNIKEIGALIKATKERFKDGVTTEQLLQLKRAADSKFGEAVLKEKTGSVVAQTQKVLGNTARNLLKTKFPTIAKALDTQSDLLTLKPILSHARAIEKTQGSLIRRGGLMAVDVTKPGTFVDAVASQPGVAKRLARLKVKMPSMSLPGGDMVGKVAQGAVGQGVSQYLGSEEATMAEQPYGPTPGITPRQAIPEEVLDQLMVQANLTNDEPAMKALETIRMMQTGGGSKVTDAQRARQEASELTARALQQLEIGSVQTGPLLAPAQELLGKVGVGDQETLEFNRTISALKAAIAKARAGTSFTPNEEKLLNQYAPTVGDTRQMIEIKLRNLQKMFGV